MDDPGQWLAGIIGGLGGFGTLGYAAIRHVKRDVRQDRQSDNQENYIKKITDRLDAIEKDWVRANKEAAHAVAESAELRSDVKHLTERLQISEQAAALLQSEIVNLQGQVKTMVDEREKLLDLMKRAKAEYDKYVSENARLSRQLESLKSTQAKPEAGQWSPTITRGKKP